MSNFEKEKKAEISIVIPAYNASKTISETIKACLNQRVLDKKFEVIVVDDGSIDNTAEIVKKYPVRYIYQENCGPAKARNTGWKAASGKIICFTDSDCVPEEDWIEKINNKYISDDIGSVGGSYGIINEDSLLARCIHEEIIQRHLVMPSDTYSLGSYNLSCRRDVLEGIGGFDESYKMASGEDNDLSYRIVKSGYKLIFDKDIKVSHYYPTRIMKYLKEQFWHGFWRVKLYRDHPDMMKGDNYSGIIDYIQPPLFLVILFLTPFISSPTLSIIVILLLVTSYILQLPMASAIVRRTKQKRYYALSFVTFLRGFARGIGMFFGGVKFFFSKKKQNEYF
jgi:glycosyltransferase involved in cell wall biosynthesis